MKISDTGSSPKLSRDFSFFFSISRLSNEAPTSGIIAGNPNCSENMEFHFLWPQLDTIYEEEEEEEEEEEDTPNSSIPSGELNPFQSFSSSPPPPRLIALSDRPSIRVHHEPEAVIIHVQDSAFCLRKEPLITRSSYLKQLLSIIKFPEINLSPPLNIARQSFALVADFCYGNDVKLTPSNVAALWTAAELLGMTEVHGSGEENLRHKAEAYFRREVAVSREKLAVVLQSCFSLLPEAETAASLVTRCIEALSSTAAEDEEIEITRYSEEIRSVAIHDLQVTLDSASQRLIQGHDLLYRIIDIYLKENDGKLSEEEKIHICNCIDCSSLSLQSLMLAVKHPWIPLRFVLQAMLIEQRRARHCTTPAADHREGNNPKLKADMSASTTRIQAMEEELSRLGKLLREPGRSSSCRFSSELNRIERGQVGSISSLCIRDIEKTIVGEEVARSYSARTTTSFGSKLMTSLKGVFRLQKKNKGKS